MKILKTALNSAAIVLTIMVLASCSSSKTRLPYFEDIKNISDGEFGGPEYEITIQPNDELFITVSSMIPEASVIYNLPLATPAYRGQIEAVTTAQFQTYIVSSKGNIDFPILGRIHVEGLTTEQLADQLAAEISKDVENPTVRVDLLNFRVNVLGEVKSPGPKGVNSQRFSVIDALAAAGDMTEYGERSNVILIREENGKKMFHHLDLNKSDLLESPYFYLKQNDVIYVMPNNIRQANSKYNQYNSYKISVISTIVSASSVIASLVIALTIK